MSNFNVLESSVWVNCPFYNCLKKVYLRSIPEHHLFFCGGCDDANGTNCCNNCISFITSLMETKKIDFSDYVFIDPLLSSRPELIGTLTNPIQLK